MKEPSPELRAKLEAIRNEAVELQRYLDELYKWGKENGLDRDELFDLCRARIRNHIKKDYDTSELIRFLFTEMFLKAQIRSGDFGLK